jgi:hypothetical protein
VIQSTLTSHTGRDRAGRGHSTLDPRTPRTAPSREARSRTPRSRPRRLRGNDLLAFANRSLVDPAHLEREHDRSRNRKCTAPGLGAEADGSTRPPPASVPDKDRVRAGRALRLRVPRKAATCGRRPGGHGHQATVRLAAPTPRAPLRAVSESSPEPSLSGGSLVPSDGQRNRPAMSQFVPAGRSYPKPGPAPAAVVRPALRGWGRARLTRSSDGHALDESRDEP